MRKRSETRSKKVNADAVLPQSFRQGALVYTAGTGGHAWRVVSGAVRLDRPGVGEEGNLFASIALKGDVIGAETMLFGTYTFEARALSPCVLEPWMAEQPSGEALLMTLAAAERRTADVVSLRCGHAVERVKRFVFLLARGNESSPAPRVALPNLRDMADIMDLTVETVSRAITRLGKEGVISRQGWRFASVSSVGAGLPEAG
ncbi:MAG: Crp/Fnr family transcriptional regulator [Zoogloea sp.]|nr:Crp/Fnr family transcriptional regulator [Zoogloea sp.]